MEGKRRGKKVLLGILAVAAVSAFWYLVVPAYTEVDVEYPAIGIHVKDGTVYWTTIAIRGKIEDVRITGRSIFTGELWVGDRRALFGERADNTLYPEFDFDNFLTSLYFRSLEVGNFVYQWDRLSAVGIELDQSGPDNQVIVAPADSLEDARAVLSGYAESGDLGAQILLKLLETGIEAQKKHSGHLKGCPLCLIEDLLTGGRRPPECCRCRAPRTRPYSRRCGG